MGGTLTSSVSTFQDDLVDLVDMLSGVPGLPCDIVGERSYPGDWADRSRVDCRAKTSVCTPRDASFEVEICGCRLDSAEMLRDPCMLTIVMMKVEYTPYERLRVDDNCFVKLSILTAMCTNTLLVISPRVPVGTRMNVQTRDIIFDQELVSHVPNALLGLRTT